MADFSALGLDPRILRALSKRGFERPTSVQAEAVPRALEGRDVIARARTGSGKTLAYLLPALHRVLQSGKGRSGWQALILVPTKELCEQVREEAATLVAHCGEALVASALLAEGIAARGAATSAGQIVVSTPARVAKLVRDGTLAASLLARTLSTLVLDEADLLLSYGYREDIATIAPVIPRSCQCMLMSATSSAEVDTLTQLVLQNPVSLDLLGALPQSIEGNALEAGTKDRAANLNSLAKDSDTIDHRRLDLPAACGSGGVKTEMTEKLLHLLTLLRLALVQKKVLIFVNSPDSGMRVRLFLEAFGVRASLLSADQPLNSRHHILQEFNKGLFDYLIATDDVHGSSSTSSMDASKNKSMGREANTDGGRVRKSSKRKKDAEFGVTRGIDFKGVSTVINFDMPNSFEGYVHRVGRTGRAGLTGTAVTLVAPSETEFADSLGAALSGNGSGSVTTTSKSSAGLTAFDRITVAAVEGLRYRGEDVARSVTKNVIKEARARDLKVELLNSKRLAEFFEERPRDLALLRHDRPVAAAAAAGAAAPHLKHIPAYLRDPSLQGKSFVGSAPGTEGRLPVHKRRKVKSVDPIKGFTPAPKRGADRLEQPTEIELRAEAAARKERKALKKRGAGPLAAEYMPKRNVRRNKGRKR